VRNLLFLLVFSLWGGLLQAQTKVSTADFARRPNFYQGKTILLSNVSVIAGEIEQNEPINKAKSRPKPQTRTQDLKEKFWAVPLGIPRCKTLAGWTLVQPQIPNLNTPMCFAVMTKINDRLPQNKQFQADIVIDVDIRGISQIKRIKILK
jgi:hypothetical protein